MFGSSNSAFGGGLTKPSTTTAQAPSGSGGSGLFGQASQGSGGQSAFNNPPTTGVSSSSNAFGLGTFG